MASDTLGEEAVFAAMSCLVETMEDVTDPRGRQGRLHLLTDILTIAVLGCVCGCDDAEALEDWAHKELNWLEKHLEFPAGVPSQDTYLRVLAAVDERDFRAAFMVWAQRTFPGAFKGGQIALDGKTARRSGDKAFEQSAVHMVSALACDYGLVLAQQPTENKSNELNALRSILNLLHMKGSLISIDAMGCQRDVAATIRRREGDYLFGLKKNQLNLQREVQEPFEATLEPVKKPADIEHLPTMSSFQHTDAGHGRIEVRHTHVIHDWMDWVPESDKWSDLSTLICVDARREHETTGVIETNRRYYISSRHLTAEEAHRHVRAHWRIENGLHHVLDVTFNEDSYRARRQNAANNFIVIRHFAISLIRSIKDRKYSIKRTRRLCDYNPKYRDELLARASY